MMENKEMKKILDKDTEKVEGGIGILRRPFVPNEPVTKNKAVLENIMKNNKNKTGFDIGKVSDNLPESK